MEFLNLTLDQSDPEMYKVIMKKKSQPRGGLNLISSKNFTSLRVLWAQSACLINKFCEGYLGKNICHHEVLKSC
ncbi:Pyridoxal-phosphate-dependent serine hydroxymethyltransferase, partial [Stegodyphus mimosarum]